MGGKSSFVLHAGSNAVISSFMPYKWPFGSQNDPILPQEACGATSAGYAIYNWQNKRFNGCY